MDHLGSENYFSHWLSTKADQSSSEAYFQRLTLHCIQHLSIISLWNIIKGEYPDIANRIKLDRWAPLDGSRFSNFSVAYSRPRSTSAKQLCSQCAGQRQKTKADHTHNIGGSKSVTLTQDFYRSIKKTVNWPTCRAKIRAGECKESGGMYQYVSASVYLCRFVLHQQQNINRHTPTSARSQLETVSLKRTVGGVLVRGWFCNI